MEKDHRDLLISLMGATYAGLKNLDDSIIGSSSTLVKRSDEVKKELGNVLRGAPAVKPDVPILNAINIPQVPFQQPIVNIPYNPPPEQPVQNDGQLELDFNKKTRYEDIIAEVEKVNVRITKIEEKLDKILKIISDPKKKDTGLTV